MGYPGRIVVGVDEVGRGCLAGPVVAGAVVLPASFSKSKTPWLTEVTDSKLLTPLKRERLAPLIRDWSLASGIGVATVEEIDRINIHQASHLAMARAIEALAANLKLPPDHVLVDGKFAPKNLAYPITAIIKGDQKCLSIACASILAKVWRDQYMMDQEVRFPGYGFGIHKGYSTAAHSKALAAHGVCELHRRSFRPVAERLALQSQTV